MSVISLLLLLQGLFPAQTHSKLIKDDAGQLVEVCTLYGLKTIELDANGHPIDDKNQSDDQRSPAMALSNLMAETVTDITLPVIVQQDVLSYSFPSLYKVEKPEVTSVLMPIRAPPIA